MRIDLKNIVVASLASFLLVGCTVKNQPQVATEPKVPAGTIDVVDKPNYQADKPQFGQKERGYASWYGKELHGERVASGETFDMYALTAAHRTIPFNSLVKVTNLKNGKSAVVRINDRGPYNQGRIIDLSYKAALDLGITNTGSAEVQLEVMGKSQQSYTTSNTTVTVSEPSITTTSRKDIIIKEEMIGEDGVLDDGTINNIGEIESTFVKPKRKPKRTIYKGPKKSKTNYSSKKRGSVMVQIGSFTNRESAVGVQKRAQNSNPSYQVIIVKRFINGRTYHKVAIKGFANRGAAKRFISNGRYNGAYIIR